MKAVLTLTLNPAIDKTLEVDHLVLNGLNKVQTTILDPGGKGINVSKTVQVLGGSTVAMGIYAGSSGEFILESLDDMGIKNQFLRVSGESRTNLKILDKKTHHVTEINEIGPLVTGEQQASLMQLYEALLDQISLVVISGSVPPGFSEAIYGDMITAAQKKSVPTFLDADGQLFEIGLKSKPTMIKPNSAELERYFKKIFIEEDDYVKAIQYFLGMGVSHVFISLGAEGALYGNVAGYYRMKPIRVEAHSSVGAGDAFVAACAYGYVTEMKTEEMLKLAIATSAGAVTTIGTKAISRQWIDEHLGTVVIERGEYLNDEHTSKNK